MRGGARRLYSIFFRSVWQIPQASTRTRISPGPISGMGTCSTETTLWPFKLTVRSRKPPPGAHYHSSRLMSIDAWRGQKVVFDFLQIGVADPTSFHTDLKKIEY